MHDRLIHGVRCFGTLEVGVQTLLSQRLDTESVRLLTLPAQDTRLAELELQQILQALRIFLLLLLRHAWNRSSESSVPTFGGVVGLGHIIRFDAELLFEEGLLEGTEEIRLGLLEELLHPLVQVLP